MPPLTLGYKASAEQFPPRRLLDLAVAAENAGFDSVWTSDHFQPWRHTDGHAPNALVWLGAATQATSRVTLGTSVLTPTFRYNPAVVAQAFATLGCLAPGRVILGVGTGESLNEVPVGVEWPEQSERFARLRESVRADPAALARRAADVRGPVLPHRERDHLRPAGRARSRSTSPPPGPAAARLAGRIADGLICTSGKGAELYTETLLPGVAEGAEKAGRDAVGPGPDDRDEGLLRHRPRPGDGGHQGVGRPRAPAASRRWASTTRSRWSAWRRRRSPMRTGAGWSPMTPTSTSSRSRPYLGLRLQPPGLPLPRGRPGGRDRPLRRADPAEAAGALRLSQRSGPRPSLPMGLRRRRGGRRAASGWARC